MKTVVLKLRMKIVLEFKVLYPFTVMFKQIPKQNCDLVLDLFLLNPSLDLIYHEVEGIRGVRRYDFFHADGVSKIKLDQFLTGRGTTFVPTCTYEEGSSIFLHFFST